MLRLFGIFALGNLLFGGRHHRRALGRGLLFGALLGYLANKDFDADRVAEDIREKARKAERAARKAKRAARDAVRAAKREIRETEHDRWTTEIHEKVDARRAEREERIESLRAEIEARKARREDTRQTDREQAAKRVYALPVSGVNEAKVIRELTEDLERDARTAEMAADVPVIDFPEEDEKYHCSRKYGVSL